MTVGLISPAREKILAARMNALGVREEDLEEQFVRSSGAGGQKVNKTSSCVVLHHRPTGIRVKCQQERSQAQNRYLARTLLLDKLTARREQADASRAQEIARLRRQKRKRSRAAKLKLRADKRHQAEKKAQRRSVGRGDFDIS
jgi:protein subunit release factor B